jgi:hypothetical protein
MRLCAVDAGDDFFRQEVHCETLPGTLVLRFFLLERAIVQRSKMSSSCVHPSVQRGLGLRNPFKQLPWFHR